MIFKHSEDNLFEYVYNDYDVHVLIRKLKENISKISTLGYVVEFSDIYDINQDIAATELDEILSIHVTKPDIELDAIYNLEIPTIVNNTLVKDRSRFIQRQLRDSFYLHGIKTNSNYVRVLSDVDIEFDIYEVSNELYYDVKTSSPITSGKAIPLYLYLNEDKPNLFETEKDEIVMKNILECSKLKDDKLFKAITTNNSINKYMQTISILKMLYLVSPMISSKFSSITDMIYDSYKFLKSDSIKLDNGLNVSNRRVRNIHEIIYSSLVTQFITMLTSDVHLQNVTRRNKVVRRIEIIKDLYEFIQIEQLESPLASLANKTKITLTGKGAFKKENVPTRLKNLHETTFGNIDPAVTPDRDGTGVILFLSSSCKMDEFGSFDRIDYLNDFETNA